MTPPGWGKTMSEDKCGETCKRANLCYACSRELGGWQELTDDDVHELTKDVIAFKSDVVAFVRKAEAKLKEKNT
tara:strand:+ start:234 stop:455 length:222 start_codon:yes stop_codon:yes gene_type:complete